jgi:phosphopantetheine adenylyltransferase
MIAVLGFVFYLHGSGQIQFIPEKFAEEFWKFLVNLGSIIFGFILINVYWAEKEQRDKINQGKNTLLNYIIRINRASNKVTELLALVFSNEAYLIANQERDEEITSLVDRIGRVMSSMESIAVDPLVLNDMIGRKVYIEIIGEELFPAVDAILRIKNFRGKHEEFKELIEVIKKSSSEGIGYLTGQKKLEA